MIQKNRNNADFVIIDVRKPSEYAIGHIENAVNIDFNTTTFREDFGRLDRTKKYLVYCKSGNRSQGATAVMKELDFYEIYNMSDGITEWNNAGYPTTN